MSRSESLLAWYDLHKRSLPWRGPHVTPYETWLSETMLQQTTVPTVIPYFQSFLRRWPTIYDLAQASLDDVLHEWQGLGYYARARNLHKCAQVVATEFSGKFPPSIEDLLRLPGIGPYTASAIGAIAFGLQTAAVDGNVLRIISRVEGINVPKDKLYQPVKEALDPFVPRNRAGDFAQALMDLGSQICTPKDPQCSLCPWLFECSASNKGTQESYPVKAFKKPKPTKHAIAYVNANTSGQILLRKRPLKGLLAGMMEVPTTPWVENPWEAPVKSLGVVKHTFTHFHLNINVSRDASPYGVDSGFWIHPDEFHEYPISTLMKKVLRVALKELELPKKGLP